MTERVERGVRWISNHPGGAVSLFAGIGALISLVCALVVSA